MPICAGYSNKLRIALLGGDEQEVLRYFHAREHTSAEHTTRLKTASTCVSSFSPCSCSSSIGSSRSSACRVTKQHQTRSDKKSCVLSSIGEEDSYEWEDDVFKNLGKVIISLAMRPVGK